MRRHAWLWGALLCLPMTVWASDDGYSLTVNRRAVQWSTSNCGVNCEILVSWTAPPGHNVGDSIRLYKVGAPDSAYHRWFAISSWNMGTTSFTIPTTAVAAGDWVELRMFRSTGTKVVTSCAIHVVSGMPAIPPGLCVTPD